VLAALKLWVPPLNCNCPAPPTVAPVWVLPPDSRSVPWLTLTVRVVEANR
jgi:hypothetical protein